MASLLAQVMSEKLEVLATRPLAPVEVAVLDSGVDSTHPDLRDRVTAGFVVEMVDGQPTVTPRPLTENPDKLGHGTAVASIIAKLAPNAQIVDIRKTLPGLRLAQGCTDTFRRATRPSSHSAWPRSG